MTHDGREVANFVLDYCEGEGREVTNLALQKLIYFCHVWSLIGFGRPLISHQFEAWEFGPVIPYLYREFKQFDRSGITGRATRINVNNGSKEVVRYLFDDETLQLLRDTLGFYSRIRASDLVGLSHVEGGPWHKVWYHQGIINPGMKIDNREMVAFYSKAIKPFSIQ